MKFGNLHLHSNYSDAMLTPEQLVLIGKSLGYKAIALTDHDTDAGFRELKKHADREGIDSMIGAEFVGMYKGVALHITALDYDPDNPGIRSFIKSRIEIENERNRKCFMRGVEMGFIEGLTWDDVIRYNPNGAYLCIDSIFNAYKIMKLEIPENFRQVIYKDPAARAFDMPFSNAEDVIKIIRRAGGVATHAHPYHGQTRLIPELVELGLNGVEVCHPSMTEDEMREASDMADAYKLYRSGGTDHTGPMSGVGGKHAIPVFNGVTEEEYATLRERRLG